MLCLKKRRCQINRNDLAVNFSSSFSYLRAQWMPCFCVSTHETISEMHILESSKNLDYFAFFVIYRWAHLSQSCIRLFQRTRANLCNWVVEHNIVETDNIYWSSKSVITFKTISVFSSYLCVLFANTIFSTLGHFWIWWAFH